MLLERGFGVELVFAAPTLVMSRLPTVMSDDVLSVAQVSRIPREGLAQTHLNPRIESKGAFAHASWSRTLNLAGFRIRNGHGHSSRTMSASKSPVL